MEAAPGMTAMTDIDIHLVSTAIELAPLDVLKGKPTALLGVSPEAADALETLDIHSVFDLAASRVFTNASSLVDASRNPSNVVARLGLPASDVVDAALVAEGVRDLQNQPIGILDGVGAAAPGVANALGVSTVRELALWPPYLAAKDIFQAVFFPDSVDGTDRESPSDLIPKSGEYPTERVFYSTLVLDPLEEQPGAQPLEAAGQVDVAPAAAPDFGFKKPAVGALLTFAQSWYAQGVSLGQLLHSVALAPGENTRIAMIDWSRRTFGRQAEDVTETEQLTNVTEHSRALGEVTSAVAREAQTGFSETSTAAMSSEGGSGLGFSAGPITIGETSSGAASQSKAMSFSSSSGQREIAASMTQNVVDRTQQQANAARNRRATVVKEVSQSEHEQVSTRVVANYNHMHALSVQYYEVVQIYRVTVALSRATKCLFVPMLLIDFTKPDLVKLFRVALAAAPLDEESAQLLRTNFDVVDMHSETAATLDLQNASAAPATSKDAKKTVELPNNAVLTNVTVIRSRGGMNDLLPLTTLSVKQRDGSLVVPVKDTAGSGPTTDSMNVSTGVAANSIESIQLAAPVQVGNDHSYNFTFTFSVPGGSIFVKCNIVVDPGPAIDAITFKGGGVRQRLIDHLVANKLHYSQVAFMSLDASTSALLLSQYTFRGKPLVSQIDAEPLAVAGNYVVFKLHTAADPDSAIAEEREWAAWLADHGVEVGYSKEDLVPLPSGGVFAEAVLGRFNAAEKLDITRFWNWQDSPIPLQAPEIAAIQTGTRATEEDLKAQPFSQPLVNIVSPSALPDPTGMAGILAAIQNGNMFRDMSGLAATIGLARSGLEATSAGAGRAGAQAGANLVTAAQKEVEMAKTAVAALQAIMGKGGGETGSGKNISQQGAQINHARSMDERGVESGSPGGEGVAAGGDGSQGFGGGGGSTSSGGGDGTEMVHVERPGSYEAETQKSMLYPGLGQPPADFIRTVAATDQGDGVDLAGGAQQDWVMLTPPPIVQQDSLTCWAAALDSWRRAHGNQPVTYRQIIDRYIATACIDHDNALPLSTAREVFAEWGATFTKYDNARALSGPAIRQLLRTNGPLLFAQVGHFTGHVLVVYGSGFDPQGRPDPGYVSVMDPLVGQYKNLKITDLDFPIEVGRAGAVTRPAACLKNPAVVPPP